MGRSPSSPFYSTTFYPATSSVSRLASCHHPDPAQCSASSLASLPLPSRPALTTPRVQWFPPPGRRQSRPWGLPFLVFFSFLSSRAHPRDSFASCHLGAFRLILQDSGPMSCPQRCLLLAPAQQMSHFCVPEAAAKLYYITPPRPGLPAGARLLRVWDFTVHLKSQPRGASNRSGASKCLLREQMRSPKPGAGGGPRHVTLWTCRPCHTDP